MDCNGCSFSHSLLVIAWGGGGGGREVIKHFISENPPILLSLFNIQRSVLEHSKHACIKDLFLTKPLIALHFKKTIIPYTSGG